MILANKLSHGRLVIKDCRVTGSCARTNVKTCKNNNLLKRAQNFKSFWRERRGVMGQGSSAFIMPWTTCSLVYSNPSHNALALLTSRDQLHFPFGDVIGVVYVQKHTREHQAGWNWGMPYGELCGASAYIGMIDLHHLATLAITPNICIMSLAFECIWTILEQRVLYPPARAIHRRGGA